MTAYNNLVEGSFKQLAAAGLAAGMLGTAPMDTSAKSNQSYSVQSVDPFVQAASEWIGKNEIGGNMKKMYTPYNDSKGIPTIGIGHKILPNEKFTRLTHEQVLQLFEHDMQSRLRTAKSLFPKFDTYPIDLRVALLDGVYRGDHKRAYNTTKLINAGKFKAAAKEYINHGDYRASKAQGRRHGVWQRMDRNAAVMAKYGR